MESFNFTSSKAFHRSTSLNSPRGSKFFRREPEKRKGSWGMMEILDRRSCNPMLLVSIPSIKIFPSGSLNRKRAEISDDLPAPVRPTIPIFLYDQMVSSFYTTCFIYVLYVIHLFFCIDQKGDVLQNRAFDVGCVTEWHVVKLDLSIQWPIFWRFFIFNWKTNN